MDQSTLVWILRISSFLVALLVSKVVWTFMRRKRLIKKDIVQQPLSQQIPKSVPLPSKRIILQLMKKPGYVLDYPHFFKSMHNLGFEYSENEIFGFFDENDLLYRIVNVHSPYIFPKNPQKTRSTNGIKMVMELPLGNGEGQEKYFQKLLIMAQELSDMLDAQICNEYRKPLKDSDLYLIQQEIEQFEQQYQAAIQNECQINH